MIDQRTLLENQNGKDRFEIRFQFMPFTEVALWGNEGNRYIHFYGLTDSYYWISLGDSNLLKYSAGIIEEYNLELPYNDYQLKRIVDDLYDTLSTVNESIPGNIYDQLKINYDAYIQKARLCSLQDELHGEKIGDYLFWLNSRVLDTAYLVNGPCIYFFRCKDKMLILWRYHDVEDSRERWTTGPGQIEIKYDVFLSSVKAFFGRFLTEMEQRIQEAALFNWGDTVIDFEELSKNLKQEKSLYDNCFNNSDRLRLESIMLDTDWDMIAAMHEHIMRTS